MIDFQDIRLDQCVFEVMSRAFDYVLSDEMPRFKTKRLENGKWNCSYEIPGIPAAHAKEKETEIDAINWCASNMLHILTHLSEDGVYDPEIEDSVFKDEIEIFFGNVRYNKEYNYRLFSSEILLTDEDSYMKQMIELYSKRLGEQLSINNEEIVRIRDVLPITLLIRQKKKNYC